MVTARVSLTHNTSLEVRAADEIPRVRHCISLHEKFKVTIYNCAVTMTPYIELDTCSVVAVGICWLDTSSIFLSLLLGHVPPGPGPWWQSDPLTVWPGQGQCQCCNPLSSGQLTHMGQRQQEKCRFSTFWRIAATHCPPRAIHYWQQLRVGADSGGILIKPWYKGNKQIFAESILLLPHQSGQASAVMKLYTCNK